jgi:hypothetical protein
MTLGSRLKFWPDVIEEKKNFQVIIVLTTAH